MVGLGLRSYSAFLMPASRHDLKFQGRFNLNFSALDFHPLVKQFGQHKLVNKQQ